MDAYGIVYDDPLPSLYRVFLEPTADNATGITTAALKKRSVYATLSNFDAAEAAYR
jgi:hypothetical protein